MKKYKAAVILLTLLALSHLWSSLSCADELQKIVIEKGNVEGRLATLSFRIVNPYSPELLEVMKSGVEVVFEYEVVIKRVHKNWFNITVGKMRIMKKIKYAPVSDEYIVSSGSFEGRKFYKHLSRAAEEFFGFHDLQVSLNNSATGGKKYEISVRAQLDELDVAGIFKYIPFVSNWFEVKTDWARMRVDAR